MPRRVLFLCTGNSCRSQMAEYLAAEVVPDDLKVRSAGIKPEGVNPLAMRALAEIGIDASDAISEDLKKHNLKDFDIIITLCSDARDNCPIIPPGINHEHWPTDDPASAEGDEEEKMEVFRRVRNELQQRIERLFTDQK